MKKLFVVLLLCADAFAVGRSVFTSVGLAEGVWVTIQNPAAPGLATSLNQTVKLTFRAFGTTTVGLGFGLGGFKPGGTVHATTCSGQVCTLNESNGEKVLAPGEVYTVGAQSAWPNVYTNNGLQVEIAVKEDRGIVQARGVADWVDSAGKHNMTSVEFNGGRPF